jgi:tRNA/rRNA methyltransferase
MTTIILVNTQLPENIGSAARAMANFGFDDMRLVTPRCVWPHERAYTLACRAGHVLDKCRVFPSIAGACADLRYLYATSARERVMEKSCISSRDLTADLAATPVESDAIGIMFGPEDDGLSNEDMRLVDKIIAIPTADECSSMNLAQAICVVCYSLSQVTHKALESLPTATKLELDEMLTHLEGELDTTNFFRVDHKKPEMMKNISAIFAKAALTAQEVRTMRGIIKMLAGKRRGPGSTF